MTLSLPREVIEVDQALFDLHRRHHFSAFLNPENGAEARRLFEERVTEEPAFSYRPATWADDELRLLDSLEVSSDHPMGLLLEASIRRSALLVRALRDRTPEAFDAMAQSAGWYPSKEVLAQARGCRPGTDPTRFVLSSEDMVGALETGLEDLGLSGWEVRLNGVMSARVLVDGAKRLIMVNAGSRFRKRDVRKLIVHEIQVHALRATNGAHQTLRLFELGTPNSLITEEGLALVAEARAGALSPGTQWRQGLVLQGIQWAREMGFRALYERLREEGGAGLAWGISQRLKRGLSRPGEPGVYAKDVVYFLGFHGVRRWLEAGNPIEHLYVGKVGFDDPIATWLDEGYLSLQRVPPIFSSGDAV